jgi:hypothetical protein
VKEGFLYRLIDMQMGDQGNGAVDHFFASRDDAGTAPKPGQPMT